MKKSPLSYGLFSIIAVFAAGVFAFLGAKLGLEQMASALTGGGDGAASGPLPAILLFTAMIATFIAAMLSGASLATGSGSFGGLITAFILVLPLVSAAWISFTGIPEDWTEYIAQQAMMNTLPSL